MSPRRAARPCAHPGCPNLVRGKNRRYCDTHQSEEWKRQDARRDAFESSEQTTAAALYFLAAPRHLGCQCKFSWRVLHVIEANQPHQGVLPQIVFGDRFQGQTGPGIGRRRDSDVGQELIALAFAPAGSQQGRSHRFCQPPVV